MMHLLQCCQVFESPKDQNFFLKDQIRPKMGKTKIGVNQKESKVLAFNIGVYLGCDVQAHHISNKQSNCSPKARVDMA